MIHGGLHMNFKSDNVMIQHCCLRNSLATPDLGQDLWNHSTLTPLRNINNQNQWAPGCENCQQLEAASHASFRTGMNEGLKIYGQTNLSGPARIDLMFDISCNLACRSCNTGASTYWQRHLKDHGLWNQPISTPRKKDEVIATLARLDLSNLRQLVFCGGETLLGQEYWDVADWLANNVPNADGQLTLCFQTNGTQSINSRNFDIIKKFQLVKLHISLDGVGDKFEYLRWPANWNQVTDNILNLREILPSNVMFVVEETVSIFNLLYQQELATWVDNNFTVNKEGDIINHTRHMATGIFNLNRMSQEYVDLITKSVNKNLIPAGWKENPANIQSTLAEIKKFDALRGESFAHVFPELANLYRRFW
jgi:sulfatase maturation enzyme AslB (radical SAM superfamily)